jgi:hypothetical protein
MNTKKTKKGCLLAIFLAILLMVVFFLGLFFFLDRACTMHKVSVERFMLERVYFVLSKYREAHGRWPETIDEAAAQPGMPMTYGDDSIFNRPWLYYPDAKPGTKEVLAATPDVIRMYRFPFVGWQDAVLADGTFVDFRSSTVLPAKTEKAAPGTVKEKSR